MFVCLCIDFAWSSFDSEVFSFYCLRIFIISAMFCLSSVNTYINSAAIVIFLLGFSNLICGRFNSVRMFFHLSIYSPNMQSTCTLYKCNIATQPTVCLQNVLSINNKILLLLSDFQYFVYE